MALPTPDSERYKPMGLFKEGRYGAVSLVLDEELRKPNVARLFSTPPRVTEADMLESIAHETQILRGLHHANLPVFDRVVEGVGGTWLFFDYVQGQPLSGYSGREKEIPTEWITWWLAELLDAIKALHEHDPPVVVGYIEPSDVVVEHQQLTLVDLGIFEDLCPEVAAGLLQHSPYVNFIAPERRLAVQTNPSGDLFSAAAIAFWLATGHSPDINSPKATRHVLAALRGQRPRLPVPVATLIAEALSYYPSQRPGTAAAMLAQLRPHVPDMEGQSPPPLAPTMDFKAATEDTLRTQPPPPPPSFVLREEEDDTQRVRFAEPPLPEPTRLPPMPRPALLVGAAGGLAVLLLLSHWWHAGGAASVPPPPPAAVAPPPPGASQGGFTARRNDVKMKFGHNSNLTLHAGTEAHIEGWDHDRLSLQAKVGQVDVETQPQDGVVVRLPGSASVVVSGDSTVSMTLGDSHSTVLLQQGHATCIQAGTSTPLTSGTPFHFQAKD